MSTTGTFRKATATEAGILGLSKRSGVSVKELRRWRSGEERDPYIVDVRSVAKVLGCRLSEIAIEMRWKGFERLSRRR